VSDEQLSNADSPRIDTLEPLSNVTLESFEQQAKQPFGMVSIDEGMQIDFSDEQCANAS
jgi:hypothetical protein